jgi:outer membrane protein TolC
MIFGTTYEMPVFDVSLWANLRRARLDTIRSQLDLERTLLDAAEDAGDSWDRWQQATREWEQKEAEYRLRIEYRDRQKRLFRERQSIRLDVLVAEVNLLQADANRWTTWYNLQLARLDVLRATELLLDYIEKAGIAELPCVEDEPTTPRPHKRLFHRMAQHRPPEPLVKTGE